MIQTARGSPSGEFRNDEASSPDLDVDGCDRSSALDLAEPRAVAGPRRPARPRRRRQLPARSGMAEADGALPHHRAAGHHHHLDLGASPLSDPARRTRAALRHRRRPRRLPVAGTGEHHQQEGMAGLDAAAGNDRPPALSAALHGRRPRQSARRPRHVSRHHGLPHPRHQPAGYDRHQGLLRLLPPRQCRRRRPLRSRSGRHQGDHHGRSPNCNLPSASVPVLSLVERDTCFAHSEAAC